jgi:hypothetical protein
MDIPMCALVIRGVMVVVAVSVIIVSKPFRCRIKAGRVPSVSYARSVFTGPRS